MRRRHVCALLAVPALLVAGCGSQQPGPQSPSATPSTSQNVFEATRSAGVERLLDALNSAIDSGDERALSGLLDPLIPARLRDELVTSVRNVGARATPSARGDRVRFQQFRYRLGSADAEFVVPSQLQQRLEDQGSSDSWFAPVKLDYALGGAQRPGLDEPRITLDTPFALARYDDEWKIVGDSTVLEGSPQTPPTLWDYPGLRARDVATAGGTSVALSYPDTDAEVARVVAALPAAVDAVTAFWGADWPRRAAVVATGAPAQFDGLTAAGGASGDTAGAAAAATVYASLDNRAKTVTGQRIVLTPGARSLPAPALAVVLRHELTHVATRTVTVPGAPLWLTEGVPEYVGRKGTYQRFDDVAPDLATELRSGYVPSRLPDDRDFAVDQNLARVAYQSAWSLAAFVAQRWDEARVRTLYLGVARAAKTADQDMAILNTLRLSRAEFVRQWQDWLRKQVT